MSEIPMNLTDILESAGGSESIGKLASQLGLSKSDASRLIGAVSPALLKGVQQQAQSTEGRAGLERAISSEKHQRYLDEPDRITDEETRADGNNILGHLFGSKDVSRDVAARASEDTGIDASLIKKALPIVAGLAMGAMGRQTKSSGGVGGLGALAALLGGGGDRASGADDLLDRARKLF
jgi:hypothetical protein